MNNLKLSDLGRLLGKAQAAMTVGQKESTINSAVAEEIFRRLIAHEEKSFYISNGSITAHNITVGSLHSISCMAGVIKNATANVNLI